MVRGVRDRVGDATLCEHLWPSAGGPSAHSSLSLDCIKASECIDDLWYFPLLTVIGRENPDEYAYRRREDRQVPPG